jgi:NAD+ kinase
MKILVVYKKSTYELYVIENNDVNLTEEGKSQLKEAHDANQVSIDAVKCALNQLELEYDVAYRAESVKGSEYDLVIAVGGDGTFLEASRVVYGKTLILGVNSDPSRSFGNYCKANRGNILEVMHSILNKKAQIKTLSRLSFSIDGNQHAFPAMNDLLIHHASPAGLTSYEITGNDKTERHYCSGLWVSSPSGTTGAISSFGGLELNLCDDSLSFLGYGFNKVKSNYYGLKRGISSKLTIVSKMRDGKIFVDGRHVVIDFPYNSVLKVKSNSLMSFINDY